MWPVMPGPALPRAQGYACAKLDPGPTTAGDEEQEEAKLKARVPRALNARRSIDDTVSAEASPPPRH